MPGFDILMLEKERNPLEKTKEEKKEITKERKEERKRVTPREKESLPPFRSLRSLNVPSPEVWSCNSERR